MRKTGIKKIEDFDEYRISLDRKEDVIKSMTPIRRGSLLSCSSRGLTFILVADR